MLNKKQKISIVAPVHNEDTNIEVLYDRLKEACKDSQVDYELIFVDDGSTDSSLDVMKKLRSQDRNVLYASLSRNFGHQNAIFAGMTYCTGDAVITMDADLQHPPALIPQMINLWRNGTEVVYTVKKGSKLPFIKYIIVKLSYWFISKISGLELGFGQSDFRLIDKKVLKVILKMPEYHKFLRGQVKWIGFKQEKLTYNVEKRHSDRPKYSYKSLYGLAMNGIFSFGKYPLHLVMMLGLIVLCASSLYIFAIIAVWMFKLLGIFNIPMPPGWTTLVMVILFFGSLQLMAIGILSEYVGRIYDQTKGRPIFIVRETSETEGK